MEKPLRTDPLMILNRRYNIESTFAFISFLCFHMNTHLIKKKKKALYLQLFNVILVYRKKSDGVALNAWAEERRRHTSTGVCVY